MCVIFVLCCIIMSQFFVGLRVIENVFARFIYKLYERNLQKINYN